MQRSRAGPRSLRRLPEGWKAAAFSRFSLRPLAPTIGAQLEGIKLAEVDDELFAELDRALLEWKVLVIRNQSMDSSAQGRLAQRWGELIDDTLTSEPGGDPLDRVVRFERNADTAGLENLWHTDGTFRSQPPVCTLLRAIEVPEVGGDTLFADMAAAYDNLTADDQMAIASMTARHDWSIGAYAEKYGDQLEALREQVPPVEHPVARPHPRTGRTTLFVNGAFTTHLIGGDDALLDRLCRQAEIPEYHCRVAWQPDTVVIWDNQAVQHYGVNDYFPARRIMVRASVMGR